MSDLSYIENELSNYDVVKSINLLNQIVELVKNLSNNEQ